MPQSPSEILEDFPDFRDFVRLSLISEPDDVAAFRPRLLAGLRISRIKTEKVPEV